MKITKINASFSLKKNLGQFENMDIWYSAEAVIDDEKPEEVAEKVKEFCKKLAIKEYNAFSRKDLEVKEPKTEPFPKLSEENNYEKGYKKGFDDGKKPKEPQEEQEKKEALTNMTHKAKKEENLNGYDNKSITI